MMRRAAMRRVTPVLVREAAIPAGLVIIALDRPLRVVRVAGADPAAPVIVEEMAGPNRGQLGLWSLAAVAAAMAVPLNKGGRR
ncbi:MAG: hypothetical protein K2Q10_14255 [Rhodospirillales bacterium]|nr:hypothetical protein [Rhodospirillales bacterium]